MASQHHERTLHLHIGETKTGSSYIQANLFRDRALLRQRGIVYPPGPNDQDMIKSPSVGQPNATRPFLIGRNSLPESLQNVPKDHDALVSSELLLDEIIDGGDLSGLNNSMARPFVRVGLNRLLEMANAAGYQKLSLLVLIRDPIPHAISWYNQIVKIHRHTGTLEETFQNFGGPTRVARLLSDAEHLPDVEVTVRKYESVRKHLLETFYSWLGIDKKDHAALTAPIINRSLSPVELALQRELNMLLGAKAPRLAMHPDFHKLKNKGDAIVYPGLQCQKDMQRRLEPSARFVNQYVPEGHEYAFDLTEGTRPEGVYRVTSEQIHFLARVWSDSNLAAGRERKGWLGRARGAIRKIRNLARAGSKTNYPLQAE
jgi:hypothetical protein